MSMQAYSSVGSKLTPYTLTDKELASIGRLLRATAEIEDIVSLWLSQLCEVQYPFLMVLLGRMSFSGRLGLAKQFAQARGPDITRLHNGAFETDAFRTAVKIRNAVAHGVLLGKTEKDEIAFHAEIIGPNETEVRFNVAAFDAELIHATAEMMEGFVPILEDGLKLKALREERRAQALRPHSKAQGKQQREQKPQQKP